MMVNGICELRDPRIVLATIGSRQRRVEIATTRSTQTTEIAGIRTGVGP